MTSQHCIGRTRPEPANDATDVAALIVGIWILLNAVAAVYVVSHADSPGVRHFLERLNAADAPGLPYYVD
jgi:hypothetical protein